MSRVTFSEKDLERLTVIPANNNRARLKKDVVVARKEFKEELSRVAPKKSKFMAKKVVTENGTFDSKKEYNHWQQLRIREMAGEIQNLERQKVYHIEVNGLHICKYTPDFVFIENGKTVVQDVKGYKKGAAFSYYRLRRKLMFAVHGIDVIEI